MNIKPHIKYSGEREQYSVFVGRKRVGSGRTLESMWRAHRHAVWREIRRQEDEARHAAEAQARARGNLEMMTMRDREEEERKQQNLERARQMFRDGTYLYGPETLGLLPEA